MAAVAFPTEVTDAVERSAAPAAVSLALQRIAERDPTVTERLAESPAFVSAVVGVLAASRSLTQLCVADPLALEVLSNLDARRPVTDDVVAWKRREYLRIAARDLAGMDDLEAVGAALAAMADDVLRFAWASTPGVAVIAMGKYGGCELNYASDVDVMFVGAGDVRGPLTLAQRCFRVDVDLRPEGRNGPLVRTLDAFESYWERWAQTWEFQALLKVRPCAGSAELGRAFGAAAGKAVWERHFGAAEVRSVRAMKARAEGEVAKRGLTDRELKRGRGGIRDIEFAVQLLQLVHGGADPSLRSPTTLTALEEMARAGYVDHSDATVLADAYRFLRTVEHRLQLWDEAQVHAVPAGGEALDRLARVCGYRGTVDRDASAGFMAALSRHQAAARAIHERLFFRPLLGSFAGTAMPEGAVAERLAAFGFTSASRTRDALAELTRGLTRTSRLMDQMLPLLLAWLSETPDPDGGLLGLRTLASSQHRTDALARMFRDAPDGARRLCVLLGSSPLMTVGLKRNPELVADLADPAAPAPVPVEGVRAVFDLPWRAAADRLAAVRRLRAREELSIQVRDLLGAASVDEVARGLTALAEAVLDESLRVARQTTGVDVPVAVLAMGRFGGAELSYASDLDVMVVHDGDAAEAERLAVELRRVVNGATPAERIYPLDFDLRPEGRNGPMVRSLAGYDQYYGRWAQTWERQALLRGRFAAGDESLGERFAEIARAFLGRPLSGDQEREIRRMKARIERERIRSSDDPDFHLKLGRGGLSDVEWTVQLLQLRHRLYGHPGTMAALDALLAAGVVSDGDAAHLRSAYEFCERTRNRLYLVRGAPGDALPARADQLGKLAVSLATTGTELREEYRRVTRRCRAVTERLFYGVEGPPDHPRWSR